MGIHVKAVAPLELVREMLAVENDIQDALNKQGLELGSYELLDRDAIANESDESSAQQEAGTYNDVNEVEDAQGHLDDLWQPGDGIFVDRTV